MNTHFINELSEKLSQLMPPGVQTAREDLEKNVRALLHSSFEKFDLVSREEFEVQQRVLSRTRSKVEALEKQVAELEQHLKR